MHLRTLFVAVSFVIAGQSFAGQPIAKENWPQFRGVRASGVAEGHPLPTEFDATTGKNLKWKTEIPGLAHSSPIVWGNRVFVTTAVSSADGATFKPGLYGDGDASEDTSEHEWRVIALNKHTGEIEWNSLAHKGVPQSKRHIKATYANCTPSTNGEFVAAFFGSEGLFSFDMTGRRIFRKLLGDIDVGAYDLPEYEWGPASSPIFYGRNVILQIDQQGESWIGSYESSSARENWRTSRDELPSWGTPTFYEGPKGEEIITNGSKAIRSYDPRTGELLWTLEGSSNITAPTPIFADHHIVVCSGRRPVKPIFVIRGGGRGDLSLPEGETSSDWIAWSSRGKGPYMPTPIIYGDLLYVLNNDGAFTCYTLKTGEKHFRLRVKHGGSGFSASPVAGDGKIYMASEDGDVFVVQAGNEFKQIAQNRVGEPLMATPAISEGVIFVRGERTLFAFGD